LFINKSIGWNYLWQPCLATAFIIAVLTLMNHFDREYVLWAVGAGSLSSSAYIVFSRPCSLTAKPLHIIGGYVVGVLSGVIFRTLIMHFRLIEHGFIGTKHFYLLGTLAACSVGLCVILMSIFKAEHPPAAGMALVMVIDLQDYKVTFLILTSALFLGLLKQFLRNYLVNL